MVDVDFATIITTAVGSVATEHLGCSMMMTRIIKRSFTTAVGSSLAYCF